MDFVVYLDSEGDGYLGLLICVWHELHISVDRVGNDLGAGEAHSNATVIEVLWLPELVIKLSENFEKLRNSALLDALPIIGDHGFENHLVWQVLGMFLQLRGDAHSSFLPIVLDGILNDVENDQLV